MSCPNGCLPVWVVVLEVVAIKGFILMCGLLERGISCQVAENSPKRFVSVFIYILQLLGAWMKASECRG